MAESIPGARFVNLPGADVEARQALVVLPVERGVGPPGGCWLAIGGCARTVVARIASPLGERVVVDLDASPVTVLAHDPA
jgi:hypothetical protein